MSDEYIIDMGKALYDPDTGEAVFKPEFKQKLIRCRDCEWSNGRITINGISRTQCGNDERQWHRLDFFCADGVERKTDECPYQQTGGD